ncbi:polysaccharide biosynthesis/export family protein [candidate division KSB1 bacterium]|nr:polysaccharide biosynthesis/export family protein [candidate division KSB1 bacterium]
MIQRRFIWILFFLGYCFAYSAFPQSSLFKKAGYTFQPGDGIRIKVWQLIPEDLKSSLSNQLTDDYTIDGDGSAVFPIIGKIKVTGMSSERLSDVLLEKYVPYIKDPVIYVIPLIRVILQGEFNKPGAYRIEPSGSLWEVVEQAEGPSSSCDLKKMRVERGGKVIIGDLMSQFEKGYSITDIGIQSGDQIIAPEKNSISFRLVRDYLTFLMTAVILYKNYSELK